MNDFWRKKEEIVRRLKKVSLFLFIRLLFFVFFLILNTRTVYISDVLCYRVFCFYQVYYRVYQTKISKSETKTIFYKSSIARELRGWLYCGIGPIIDIETLHYTLYTNRPETEIPYTNFSTTTFWIFLIHIRTFTTIPEDDVACTPH